MRRTALLGLVVVATAVATNGGRRQAERLGAAGRSLLERPELQAPAGLARDAASRLLAPLRRR